MSVLRGTFRLSVVVALVLMAYLGFKAHIAARDAASKDFEFWRTMQCAQRFLDQDMSRYANPTRPEMFDIGKAGCSYRTFWATFDEIRSEIGSADPRDDTYSRRLWPELEFAFYSALLALAAVNLLGLLFLAARGALRWVWAGYR
jgi:hypothetical protein